MSIGLKISPLDLPVQVDGPVETMYEAELRDLSRSLCGALLLALPLLYTMEMWARARAISNSMTIIILISGYFINVAYCHYSGFKGRPSTPNPWLDALESIGVGIVASALTLLLIDQVTGQMSLDVILSCIVIESVPASFGASLAKSQLSARNKDSDQTEDWPTDWKKVVACLLGGIMFAFNVGATQEPTLIAASTNSIQLIGIIVFSLFINYLMVFMTGFEKKKDDENSILGPAWAETLICYTLSFLISGALLWMFGYLTTSTPHTLALPWIIVLSYATSLGGSAGRLVI